LRIRIRQFSAQQATQWFSCGWRLWRRQPLATTVPVAVFVSAALLLRWIPVFGDVIVLLFLPTVVASLLFHVHGLTQTSGSRRRRKGFKPWLMETRQALFGIWVKSENVFPLVLLGFLLVVIGLLGYALVTGVGGQAVTGPYPFQELTLAQMSRFVLAYLLVIVLWLTTAAALLWAVPLLVIRDLALFDALKLGWRGMRQNGLALLTMLLGCGAVLVPAVPLKLVSPIASLLVWWSGTLLAALLLVFSSYCSYRLVFAVEEMRPAPAVQPRPASRSS